MERPHGGDQALGALPICNIVTVDDRGTARIPNFGDYLLRGILGRGRSVESGAEIVDDDLRTLRRERERMGTADSATCARHDDYPAFA